jgi:subtilisin family serine protease
MRNPRLAALLGLCLLALSCTKTPLRQLSVADPDLIPAAAIDAFIREKMQQEAIFNWASASDEMVWSALQQSDQVLSVGYRPAGETGVEDRLASIRIQDPEWRTARNKVLDLILGSERVTRPALTENELVQWAEDVLPVLDVRIERFETVQLLRASNLVRYAEPMGYEPEVEERGEGVLSSSGCGSNVANASLVAGTDFINILPNTKQSWNYTYHGIPGAWAKATGAGIKVFIIDSGCELDQENLGSAFNQGSSSGRTIERIVTLPRSTFLGIPTGPVETADDGCGHGTAMAGACAAPRGTDGAACGVAYNCNLVTCRAAADVFLDESREVKGVSTAFTNAANRSDVRIISMSMGRITSSSQLSDAIKYAFGKNKLIFCAAGTSFGWTSGWFGVIFPATMPEVNAVTGVRDNNFMNACSDCHLGSQTDFTVVMEKSADGKNPLTLAMRGDAPSTVGGSSVATASMAGIAALVWSRYPSLTSSQLLNRLIQYSANYPTRSSSFGWGMVNADAATN